MNHHFHTVFCILLLIVVAIIAQTRNSLYDDKQAKKAVIKKHLKRLKKEEGAIKLVGGRDEFEGNVEILHEGQWGAICDDEWDSADASVICKQLGYQGNAKATYNSRFGHPKRKYWMDNVYCDGTEEEITKCRFDGWGVNDCDPNEAAGVVCQEVEVITTPKPIQLTKLPKNLKVRLRGGRIRTEGRVEINKNGFWQSVCGQGWSLLEAMVVCRTLGMGYALSAFQSDIFGNGSKSIAQMKCQGSEFALSECLYDPSADACEAGDVAALQCTEEMADLVIDHLEIIRTAHLEDRQLYFLQCAMEENCLASQAYVIQKESSNWHLETRRLLKFTARILNSGTADFRPAIPKHLWEWHMCHMHYHSMEVFATFDIYDGNNVRVAEGHKASFCLEDNQCLPGVEPKYACANYGDQGISVNCTDIYKYTVDCQWVDISDISPGFYTLKVAVNPEFKVPEMSFDNNAAYCQFYYGETMGTVSNCSIGRP